MIRSLHRWAGLTAALLLTVIALNGAVLAFFPAAEAVTTAATAEVDLASFAAQVQAAVPGLEAITQGAGGEITAYSWSEGEGGEWIIDPANGAVLGAASHSQFELWATDLHRSLFAGDAGRIAVGLASLFMAVISASGFALAARRLGGWKKLFSPLKGPFAQRWHTELARIAGVGLLVSSLTGAWLFGLTFGILPSGSPMPAYPEVSGVVAATPAELTALQDIQLADLRELVFPREGNAGDAFEVETAGGFGYVDQGTGEVLAWSDRTVIDRVSDVIHMLHTGAGAAVLGILLALSALTVPVLSVTGLIQQAGHRGARSRSKIKPDDADTIVLVGSEGGSTWSFAEALRAGLAKAGHAAFVGPMSGFAPEHYAKAERIILLAATSGDGDTPGSALGFLDRLAEVPAPVAPVAVLGFGDSDFPRFCGYGEDVHAAAAARGWPQLLPFATVDRQSEQDFARWGAALAEALGIELTLDRDARETTELTLISRRDYGVEVQAPTAILRFARPRRSLRQRLTGRGFGRFQAGDLFGILPEGDDAPRFYSIASATRDGFLEIVVKKHPGGLCSGQLMELRPGDRVQGFLRTNPTFHAGRDKAPLILIGAGTGIGPLAGFVRANRTRRPVHLYLGTRSPTSDLFYEQELADWQTRGRLASFTAAFSRGPDAAFVQDRLRADAARIRELVEQGARIMVCGGRDMAAGVGQVLDEVLAPLALTPATLKAEARYVEDVY